MGMAFSKGRGWIELLAEHQDGKISRMWNVASGGGIGKSYLACALAKALHKKLVGVISGTALMS